ncbi:uncharacterized protein [Lolium perenne]|uniref:uncharacterized protein isoform X3 n=1 Tax=Lolium perenne TaxID=4522 RepID=UPI003A998F58
MGLLTDKKSCKNLKTVLLCRLLCALLQDLIKAWTVTRSKRPTCAQNAVVVFGSCRFFLYRVREVLQYINLVCLLLMV